MGQRQVESVIGRLVTDEAFRERFRKAPEETLLREAARGIALTPLEVEALAVTDTTLWERLSRTVDRRLQKARMGGMPGEGT